MTPGELMLWSVALFVAVLCAAMAFVVIAAVWESARGKKDGGQG